MLKKKIVLLGLVAGIVSGGGETGTLTVFADDPLTTESVPASAQQPMTFFITSVGSGNGGNLGGLEGADAHCGKLAAAAGTTGRTWRAYLSTQGDKAVNARDRIGTGPWFNAKGVMVAKSVEDLHSDKNNLTKETQLNEKGEVVNGRGDTPNRHDILTGSNLDGTAMPADTDATCKNWTSHTDGGARVGHHDRTAAARTRPRGTPPTPSTAAARKRCERPAATGCSTALR